MRKKIFYIAILLHPTAEEAKNGKSTELLFAPMAVLATDQNAALLLAAREIPEKHLQNIDRVEVAVAPF